MGCGAHLFSLRRTRIGPFKWEDSLGLKKVADIQANGGIKSVLLSIEKAVGHLPSVVVSASFAKKVKDGIPLKSSAVMAVEGDINENQTISLKNEQKRIIAIGKALADTGKFLDLKYPNRLFEYLRVI